MTDDALIQARARNALCVTVDRAGWTLYERAKPSFGNARTETRVEGYGGLEDPTVQAAIDAGVPVVVTLDVSEEQIVEAAVSSPFLCQSDKPDEPPYHWLSRAPLAVYIDYWRGYGATIHNA